MGFLTQLASVAAPARLHAMTSAEYAQAFWGGDAVPDLGLGSSGGSVTPETALTLSYVYCAVSTISDDFGTSTCQMFENLGDDARARVKYSDPGIGTLARKLRWQPNAWQTAKAFWSTLAWQYLLRPAAYAEIIYRAGVNGFVDQLVPRHPDRVRQEMLPSGRVRFRLQEPGGQTRYVTQDEMFVVRNTSSDGLNALSRIDYGSRALQSAIALQEFTRNWFRKGATAALVATYKGSQDEEMEVDLHKSLSRYLSGAENAGGLLLVPQDIDVKSLAVDPEKSQLLGLKNLSGRDVARLFKMPPSWLGIEGAAAYASQVQDAANYVNRCQMPLSVEFEQAIQRDLILAADRFYAKFNMDYLLRADLKSRMEAYEIGIKARVLRPSEARVREDMSPDPALDKLSEGDFRPGSSGSQVPGKAPSALRLNREQIGTAIAAVTCVRRERAIVTNLAKKHANDPDGWKVALRDFYGEHAQYVANAMSMPIDDARAYAAQHGEAFEAKGLLLIDGDAGAAWEREESTDLAALAFEREAVAA